MSPLKLLIGACPILLTAQTYRAPRTDDGQPDLQGIWQTRSTAAFNLEDHSASLGVPGGRGLVVDPADGKIPYRAEALKIREENWSRRKSKDPLSRCFLPGTPRVMYLSFPLQIFQTAQFVVIASEYAHSTRTIHLKGGHPDQLEFWMGDSRGRFEGETLAVDVADLNADTWFDEAGNFHSAALKIAERFTRTSADVLAYEATIDDAKTFTKPWKIRVALDLHKEKDFQLLEYECHVYLNDEQEKK